MGVIFRLALRNLTSHKTKSIIIAAFITVGVAIVIMGNSFLQSVTKGLETDFRANYTGDVAISAIPEKGTSLDIFGVTSTISTGTLPQPPALSDLERITEILNEKQVCKATTKLISSQVIVALGDDVDFSELDDDLSLTDLPLGMLFSGDENYWNVFTGLNLIEGDYPEKNTNEILVDSRLKQAISKSYHQDVKVGDTVLLMGANTNGDIREGKISGFFKPANENSAMFQCIYCDPSLARVFADLTYGTNIVEDLPDSVDLGLSDLSEEDLFSFDDFGIEDDTSILSTGKNQDFDNILGDTTLRDELNKTDDGAWPFVLAKLNHPYLSDKVVAELNQQFTEENLNARAMNWKVAANSYSETVSGISFIFNLLIIILAIVVFIIIMNTMTVSVIERTGEIGTMRAIGAEQKFVKRLFYSETLILTFTSSILGIIVSFICMGIFNSFKITITNEVAKMILGGGLLHFSPTPAIVITTIVVALLGSILSNTYPVKSALKITPLQALSKGQD